MFDSKSRRRLRNRVARPLIQAIIFVLWKTCRVRTVLGAAQAEDLLARGTPFIPCYWHQQHIFCAWYLLQLQGRGLRLGFLISPSQDGDVPARIVEGWGARAIRGSSTRTGARAMRDLYQAVSQEGISPVNTADGPTGPVFRFKPGAVMLSQLTGYPMLPMAYAAERCWQLGSWDRFIVPKPFSRIVIAIGAPRQVERNLNPEQQQTVATEMEQTLNRLAEQARAALRD